ncbi:uncharacterized protein LOC120708167 isoform X2 [Panicum virgatum]|uniref:uncharacterized protein LOC120682110 n=1 Tax=Panicum virgatum TaxID=38727 RepID=UPI0019D60A49|nr:uncharacterized protein LOC120682110 [Panicum virgatum]XP_039849227.1 uncharacterized protein LOC120708167 isoform X2 [Panicum virgatum]
MLLQQTTSKVAGDAHLFPVSEYETPTLSASVATSSSKQHLTDNQKRMPRPSIYMTYSPFSCILLSLQMKSWSTAPSQQHLCLNIIVVDAFMVLTYCWVLCYKQLFTQRPNKKLSIAPIFGSYLFTIMLLQTVAGCDCLKQIILN